MMTNLQLYLAIALPVFAIVVALIVNLVQITGIKGDVNGLRGEMNSGFSSLRGDINGLRSEMNTKLDLILAKLYEHDTDIARLKDKTGLR